MAQLEIRRKADRLFTSGITERLEGNIGSGATKEHVAISSCMAFVVTCWLVTAWSIARGRARADAIKKVTTAAQIGIRVGEISMAVQKKAKTTTPTMVNHPNGTSG